MKQYRVILTLGKIVEEVQQEMNDAAAEGYTWEGKEMTCSRQQRGSHFQSGAATETWSIVMERNLPIDQPVSES